MDILFLTESLPYPLLNRSRLRNYYLLRYLVQKHCVTLVSFTGEATRPAHKAHLAEFLPAVHTIPNPTTGRNWLRGLLSGHPAGLQQGQSAALEAVLARLVAEQRFDLVIAGQANMGQYAISTQKAARTAAPRLVWDMHRTPHLPADQEAELNNGWQKYFWQVEGQRYRRYLTNLLPQFAHTLVFTAAEKGSLLHLLSPEQAAEMAGRVHVLPIGIDEIDTDMITNEEAGAQILFLAEEDSPAVRQGLAWFLAQVFPAVRAQVPEAYLTLLARRAEWFSAELDPKRSAAGADTAGAVYIHDYISDLNPFWARSRVFVVPLLMDGGLQSGILQAWLRGVPVVSTRAGVNGLSIRPGQTNLVADDPVEFASAVVEMLTRPETAGGLARNARHWVARHYDYHTLYTDLDAWLST